MKLQYTLPFCFSETILRTNRHCYSQIIGPPGCNPSAYNAMPCADEFCPLDYSFCFPVDLNNVVITPISLLLARSGPSAISQRIRSIVVNAIKTVFEGWPNTHIGKEPSKAGAPFIGDRDTASTIKPVGVISLVVAALFYFVPYS